MNMLMEMEKELALDDEDTYPFEEEEESATKQAAEEDDSDSSGEKAGGSSADRLDDGEVDELFAAYPAEDWSPHTKELHKNCILFVWAQQFRRIVELQ